jgi:hypothetical protein
MIPGQMRQMSISLNGCSQSNLVRVVIFRMLRDEITLAFLKKERKREGKFYCNLTQLTNKFYLKVPCCDIL